MANKIEGLIIIDNKSFYDNRGYFRETFRNDNNICGFDFVQDNESFSKKAGTLRGLHFQKKPHSQAKLVRVPWGSIIDVVVDLRPESKTFGQWEMVELSAENGYQLFVPQGFAHGFCTLVDDTVVSYKVSDYYSPECDSGLIWNDPDLAIPWPFPKEKMIISDKDALLPLFSKLGLLEW